MAEAGQSPTAAANITPKRNCPSLFQPVHGSAPDMGGEITTVQLACAVAEAVPTRR